MRAWLLPLSVVALRTTPSLPVAPAQEKAATPLTTKPVIYAYNGNVRAVKGNLDRTLAVLDQVLEADPNDTEIRGKRGDLRREKGDLDGALADFNVVVEVFPKYAGAYVNRGLVFSLQEKWLQAHDDFDTALRADAKDFYPAFYRCVAQMRLGKTEEAKKELGGALAERKVAEADEWPSTIADFLLGKVDEAALLEGAGNNGAQQCEAWYFAGVVRLTAGRKAEAAECFRKSVATELKSFTEYRLARGELMRLK
jgi:lipoprotein NlpI